MTATQRTHHEHCWHQMGTPPWIWWLCCHCDAATVNQQPRELTEGEQHGPYNPEPDETTENPAEAGQDQK